VTASSFQDPCRALSLTSTSGQLGFDSGFMAVSPNATDFPTYTIQINDVSPPYRFSSLLLTLFSFSDPAYLGVLPPSRPLWNRNGLQRERG
jgi:hypothetical protein